MTRRNNSSDPSGQKASPKIAMFDMDHTLINNDCDVSWKRFLVDKGLAPPDALGKADEYYEQYKRGELDLREFTAFQLAEFVNRTPEEMEQLAVEHCDSMVRPRIYKDAQSEVEGFAGSDWITAICTSTNDVVAAPVAELFGIKNIIATNLEVDRGLFTGRINGRYCGGEGKVARATEFCRCHEADLSAVSYYGDSVADMPLLSAVGKAIAVNPAPGLRHLAEQHGWPIRAFRN
ncbi:MAG: HAD-IB family hydrolase [Lentisphaeria bacterium]